MFAEREVDEVDERRHAEAEALLYRMVERVDRTTGEATRHRVETASYREYRERRAEFDAARAVYTAAYKEAQRTPVGRRTWAALAIELQVPVTAAYDRLRHLGVDRIEQAEALLERFAARR